MFLKEHKDNTDSITERVMLRSSKRVFYKTYINVSERTQDNTDSVTERVMLRSSKCVFFIKRTLLFLKEHKITQAQPLNMLCYEAQNVCFL